MQTYNHLFESLCSYDNLLNAFNAAKKGKTTLPYVIWFNENLHESLLSLQKELREGTYKPQPLTTFIILDPKRRVISKSIFKDRVVHHALVQVLEPIFDPTFIYDSYANRLGKGTAKALERCQVFLRKVSDNGTYRTANQKSIGGYALKADIKKYFDHVDQGILLSIIQRKIKDKKVIALIKCILDNFDTKIKGKGMPLGNLTSQFFSNVYLNELDQFVKHILKVKYYMRYVDDFIILHKNKEILEFYKLVLDGFLKSTLNLGLHPDKSTLIPLYKGIPFVGFRIFYYYSILRKGAQKRIQRRLNEWRELKETGILNRNETLEKLLGWMAYAVNGNTYYLRKKIMAKFNKQFPIDEKR